MFTNVELIYHWSFISHFLGCIWHSCIRLGSIWFWYAHKMDKNGPCEALCGKWTYINFSRAGSRLLKWNPLQIWQRSSWAWKQQAVYRIPCDKASLQARHVVHSVNQGRTKGAILHEHSKPFRIEKPSCNLNVNLCTSKNQELHQTRWSSATILWMACRVH